MTAFYTAPKTLREENTPQDRIQQLAKEHSLCSVRTAFVESVLAVLTPQHFWARIELIEDSLSSTERIVSDDVWAQDFWDNLTKHSRFGLQESDQFVLAYARALATIINPQHPAKTLQWLWNNRVHASATTCSHAHDNMRTGTIPVYNACQELMELYTPLVFKHANIWRLFVGVNHNTDLKPHVTDNRIRQLSWVDRMNDAGSEPVLFSVLAGVWRHALTEMQGYDYFKHDGFLSELDKVIEALAADIEQNFAWEQAKEIPPSHRTRNVAPYSDWPAFRTQMRFDALRHCSLELQDTADEYLIEAIMLNELSEVRINGLIKSSLERLFAKYQATFNNSGLTRSFNVLDYGPCAVFYFTQHRDAWLEQFLVRISDETLDTRVRISALGSGLPTAYPSRNDYPTELMARMQNREYFGTVRVDKHLLPLDTMTTHAVEGGLYGEDPHCAWISDFPESHREKWKNAFFDLEKTLARDNSHYAHWVHTLASKYHITGHELVPYLEKALAGMVQRFDADNSFNSIDGYREIITQLGRLEPAKLLNQLLRAYRAAPVPSGCDPTVVSWSTEEMFIGDAYTINHLVDALAYLIAKEVPRFFKAYRLLDENEDKDEFRLDTELDKICMSRLKVTTPKSSPNGYSNDDCKETDWAFRCSYLKAIEELKANPGGKSHKHLDFMRKGDPDERVKKVAYASYTAVRHAKQHKDERSQHRAYLAAFWWIRIGKAESEGIDVDMTLAKRQRRRELRFIR